MSAPRKFDVGKMVRVVRIPADLTDSADIDTPGIFARALGNTYRIDDVDSYGYLKLTVGESDMIWIEPEFVESASDEAAI